MIAGNSTPPTGQRSSNKKVQPKMAKPREDPSDD